MAPLKKGLFFWRIVSGIVMPMKYVIYTDGGARGKPGQLGNPRFSDGLRPAFLHGEPAGSPTPS